MKCPSHKYELTLWIDCDTYARIQHAAQYVGRETDVERYIIRLILEHCYTGDAPMETKTLEHEYAEKMEKEGLESAKAHFRANFAVRCFQCNHFGPIVAPLNCAKRGTYWD